MILRCSKCEKNIESAGMFGSNGFTCLDYPNCNTRTKEAYEKVDGFSFALEADFNAGILFRPNGFAGHGFLKCEDEGDVAYAAANEMLFRKVTKPIEWWEDLVEYIEKTTDDSGFAESTKGEKLNIVASMTRDQWCDFARILLEQGE